MRVQNKFFILFFSARLFNVFSLLQNAREEIMEKFDESFDLG